MREKLGKFNYDDGQFEEMLGQRGSRPECTLENGAKYTGEWLESSQVR